MTHLFIYINMDIILNNKELVKGIYQEVINCSQRMTDKDKPNYDDNYAYQSMAMYYETLPMVSQNLSLAYPHFDKSFFSLIRDSTFCYTKTFPKSNILRKTFGEIIEKSNINDFLILEKHLPQELFIAYLIDNASNIDTIEMLDLVIPKYKDFIPNDVYISLNCQFNMSIEYLERLVSMNKLCENTIACMIIHHPYYGPVARKNEILSKVLVYRAIYKNNHKAFEYLVKNGVNIADFCKDKKLAIYTKNLLESSHYIKNEYYDYKYPILDFVKNLDKKEKERNKKRKNKHYK